MLLYNQKNNKQISTSIKLSPITSHISSFIVKTLLEYVEYILGKEKSHFKYIFSLFKFEASTVIC